MTNTILVYWLYLCAGFSAALGLLTVYLLRGRAVTTVWVYAVLVVYLTVMAMPDGRRS